MFNDASILITGGTGFFGINFIKTILNNYKPKKIIIYSRDEFKQYVMKQSLQEACLQYCIGDVRDINRLNYALKEIDYVVHSAAMKHITIAESNPSECIQTNIIGTENIISACIRNKVKKVIALSTDKAVSPINLYGATKLALEKLIIAADCMYETGDTTFSIVRYGNVIGSRGSVLPYFKKLLMQNAREFPITHPEMTRFWLPINNAIDVVIKAFETGKGGEIFVPKAPSINIVDLATSLNENMPIKIIGMRAGEKLHEILFTRDEINIFEQDSYYTIIPNHHLSKYQPIANNVIAAFEYSSNTNKRFLSIKEIKKLNDHEQYADEDDDLRAPIYKRRKLKAVGK